MWALLSARYSRTHMYNQSGTRSRRGGSAFRLRLCTVALIAAAPLAVATQDATPQPTSTPLTPLQPQAPVAPTADSKSEWAYWTSGRYRITPGDVVELRFPFVPELDQTLAVQPDGYVTAREV